MPWEKQPQILSSEILSPRNSLPGDSLSPERCSRRRFFSLRRDSLIGDFPSPEFSHRRFPLLGILSPEISSHRRFSTLYYRAHRRRSIGVRTPWVNFHIGKTRYLPTIPLHIKPSRYRVQCIGVCQLAIAPRLTAHHAAVHPRLSRVAASTPISTSSRTIASRPSTSP